MTDYRWTLHRHVDMFGIGKIVWVMLNPSTADDDVDDPTIRRCIGFSRAWGMAEMEVVNLFAARATDPKDLRSIDEPVGDGNDDVILEATGRAAMIVCGWGAWGWLYGRGEHVVRLLHLNRRSLLCLGTTKHGQPRHPLYLPSSVLPHAFRSTELPL